MGDPRGFLKLDRQTANYREICERVQDFKEVASLRPENQSQEQASRCMDCSTPFCHWACPIGNYIPEWNDLVYRNLWTEALERLLKTNNFPEFTGRVCPAPCEGSCVLGITDPPVTIKNIECAIIDHGWDEGWVTAAPPKARATISCIK